MYREWGGGGRGGLVRPGVNAVIATMCRLQEAARLSWDGTHLGNGGSLSVSPLLFNSSLSCFKRQR